MVNDIFCLFFSSSIFWTTFININKYNIFKSQILTKIKSFVKISKERFLYSTNLSFIPVKNKNIHYFYFSEIKLYSMISFGEN